MKIDWLGQKEWLEICARFFQWWSRGNDEECKSFVALFLVNNQSYFSKETSKSNSLLVQYHLRNLSIKIRSMLLPGRICQHVWEPCELRALSYLWGGRSFVICVVWFGCGAVLCLLSWSYIISSGCGYAYCYERWVSLSIGWGKGSLEVGCWLCAFVSIGVGMSRFRIQYEGILGFSE